MTTLYRPVLIESAEQAEALPEGTLARHSEGAGMAHAHKVRMHTLASSCWLSSAGIESNADMVGWTALVPIEVEIEHIRETSGRRRTKTLYVTPWQLPTSSAHEAQALADRGNQA